MSQEDKKKTLLESEQTPETENVLENGNEFPLGEFKLNLISSADTIKKKGARKAAKSAKADFAPKAEQEKISKDKKIGAVEIEDPIFKQLAAPHLPRLAKENRARLQMQSPTRLNFYWTVKDNPFEALRRTFGKNAGNYTLVAKLLNQTTSREEIFPIEAEGSRWFDVDANSVYRAEIGFYAPNRPFVRVMFSNSVETPRKNPSPRPAADSDWAVSADRFAQVLDNSGFLQDAFEVALAGDDYAAAERATQTAFAQMFGETENESAANDTSEMRFALLALASGYTLESLRGQISRSLFAKFQEHAENLSAEKALAALQENFGVSTGENIEQETFTGLVFGATIVNFPRVSKRKFLSKLKPASSFNFRIT
ncbi:MAG: DUF4912 domain-containing protein [Acidobacteriota bacterium]|nr:DUF4912 domain-containing protein [Acidobacteriota bacterium]